jgi:hypothetical protein
MRSRRVCLAIQQPTTVRIVGTKVLAEESCNFAVAAADESATEHPKVKKFAPGVNPRPARNGVFLQNSLLISFLRASDFQSF